MEQSFRVKTIEFVGRKVPVLLQNEFGPCALLAIFNALLLRNAIQLSTDHGSVTIETVVTLVATRLLECNAAAQHQDAVQLRQVLDDAIALLPSLETGLDVNVQFRGGFEYTKAFTVFDLLDIDLVHGWVVAEDDEAAAVLGDQGYNQVIEAVISNRESYDKAKSFLERTAAQLTFPGLAHLHAKLRERELAVLYRNMHFSTLFKYEGRLYVLVTDLGYQNEARVVWELLDDVGGDTLYVDSSFVPRPPEDPDYLMALHLQQETPLAEQSDFHAALQLHAVERWTRKRQVKARTASEQRRPSMLERSSTDE
ncbi:hypothetical protein CTAYLR_007405 [Chrysophaeum taylorii]|uniref:MINDY deubiquitinase domain-containing protein n=1 Tax=Chrysophaeum taylorii TaxID=2483200 RepID=A0AAD7XJ71_9STRA|nr:hypothetical protein CTAYLR_007405 [Chrysophaeum taylorii]